MLSPENRLSIAKNSFMLAGILEMCQGAAVMSTVEYHLGGLFAINGLALTGAAMNIDRPLNRDVNTMAYRISKKLAAAECIGNTVAAGLFTHSIYNGNLDTFYWGLGVGSASFIVTGIHSAIAERNSGRKTNPTFCQ